KDRAFTILRGAIVIIPCYLYLLDFGYSQSCPLIRLVGGQQDSIRKMYPRELERSTADLINTESRAKLNAAIRLLGKRKALSRFDPRSTSQSPGRTSGSRNPRFCLRGHLRQERIRTEVARLRGGHVLALV